MATYNRNLQRLEDTYWNDVGYTDEAHLARHGLISPAVISPTLVNLMGREDERFPLTFSTEGQGGTNIKTLDVWEYSLPVIGRLNRSEPLLVATPAGAGAGGSKISLVFANKAFARYYVLASPNGTLVRIFEDPKKHPKGWEYLCDLLPGTNPAASLAVAEGAVNTRWVSMWAPVAYSGSRGTESRSVAPGQMTNQQSLLRKSWRYEGNITNKMVNIQLNAGGKKTTMWTTFEEWMRQREWLVENETHLWYSQYNRNAEGKVTLVDENGNHIPMGAGVLDQIPNYDTYGELSTNKLKSIVRDVFFGTGSGGKRNVELQTGTGGMESFDTAIKRGVLGSGFTLVDSDRFITGSGYNMGWGGYFNQYRHIDGNLITVVKNEMFDTGPRAENSARHPITGLPMESYRMVFLDRSEYDGEPNIQMVTLKGREYKRWAVAGADVPPGFESAGNANPLRASDKDASSVHLMKASGIFIRKASNCIHLECNLS